MGGTHGAQDGTHRAYPWVNAMSTILGWKVTVVWRRTGHASQTTVVYQPTDSTAYEREMSTAPTLLWSMALLYLYNPY